jgi:hypothetical protein
MPNCRHDESCKNWHDLNALFVSFNQPEVYIVLKPFMYRDIPCIKEIFDLVAELNVPDSHRGNTVPLYFFYNIGFSIIVDLLDFSSIPLYIRPLAIFAESMNMKAE